MKHKTRSATYADIAIIREKKKLVFRFYRKPTTTDLTIPSTSWHPQEHKKSAINYLTERMNTYPLSEGGGKRMKYYTENLKKQWVQTHPKYQQQSPTSTPPPNQKKIKWATFTYFGPDTRIITKLFRNSNIKLAFKTNNTIQFHCDA
jgi:hypothetical protein